MIGSGCVKCGAECNIEARSCKASLTIRYCSTSAYKIVKVLLETLNLFFFNFRALGLAALLKVSSSEVKNTYS